MTVEALNFHHLRYFWAVASEGNLTRAAERLRISQSALSAQIRQLEDQLEQPLFLRQGRRLILTEAGLLALDYADDIFETGEELMLTLREGRREQHVFRVGAVATLSRNFQESFIGPVLDQPDLRLRLESGSFDQLLGRLGGHELDMVLANRPTDDDALHGWRCRRIASQPVSIVGRPRDKPFRYPEDLDGAAMILPSRENSIRTEFDALCGQLRVRVAPIAEVDDMATMRLLARDLDRLALLPRVVVRDELRSGTLVEQCAVPGLFETFYSITVERHFQHPLVGILLARAEDDILAMGS
jgi:LysR family transcriptional activator of nhaA